MAWSPSWLPRLAERLGTVHRVEPVAGSLWRAELASGAAVAVKSGPGTVDEAQGLRAIAAVAGGPPVPDVLFVDDGLLVTAWIDQAGGGLSSPSGVRSSSAEDRQLEDLGHALAVLHCQRTPAWGGGSSWVGRCPVDPAAWSDGPGFYRHRLAELAARAGLEPAVALVVDRLPELAPFDQPRLVHGDLWWGNVLRGADGRRWLIDPSVHGGHPEEDLAMLALFGPLPARLVAAYVEVAPLADGWPARLALWQLAPLLVHAVVFGGAYRSQVVAAARRVLAG